MIRELSELGKKLRADKSDDAWVHDALKDEPISMELVISMDGTFQQLNLIEDKLTPAEALTAKKGKARLLLDKPEEVLCYGGEKAKSKHQLFVDKLSLYKDLQELSPVLAFYANRPLGIEKALEQFEAVAATEDKKTKKKLVGNIGFKVQSDGLRIHEKPEVLRAVIEKYESLQQEQLANTAKNCSVCGKNDYPVEDIPHGMIKGVPDGQSSGCALVSYNENAFESYELKGNNNSSVCTNCAKTYVEGLNWLLSSGSEVLIAAGKKGKAKTKFRYSNRRNFGKDTAMVFWTRDNQAVEEIDLLEAPSAGEVARMIDALSSGKEQDSRYLESERFYSCTLSGAAARIAVRDWIETSLGDFRMSIAHWFKDISIKRYDFDLKEMITLYAPLYDLARSCQRKNSDDSYDKEDTATARVASSLWQAALQNKPMPLWILTKVLQRARLDKHGVTPERAALIKLILNRNNKGGDFMVMENKADGNRPVAYICGQIFAKLESIQYAALGDRNAGIREKYFTYAMTTPAAAFGRLFNLHSKHFTKLKGEKPGLAVTLDKELQELCKDVDINSFPQLFQLEEQGQFAIGYYHQKQAQFAGKTH
jgi:CRISPR-associated protein Csd1